MLEKVGVIIPHFNHGATLGLVLDALEAYALPCLVVDDGSRLEDWEAARRAAARPGVELLRLERNGGKGIAVTAGFRAAWERRWTHAALIDADNQHDAADLSRFLRECRGNPEALILAAPRFGADAPWGRIVGRQSSRFWVWLETASFAIEDPLCGYRIYPLEAVRCVLEKRDVGRHMDFDPEIAVRLIWAGTPIINIPSRVRYAPGGISHFRMVRDNLLISRMHARLCVERLARLGAGIFRKAPQ